MKPFQASLLLALCVAGCAAPSPPPPPPKPVITPAMVDGLYRGTSTRYQADSRSCPSPGLVTLHIKDGQFTYRWNARTQVPSSVQSDGSVQGGLGDVTLTGQVTLSETGAPGVPDSPQRIVGDVTNGLCGVHFTVTRRGPAPP